MPAIFDQPGMRNRIKVTPKGGIPMPFVKKTLTAWSFRPNTILKRQVTPVNANRQAVTVKSYDTVLRNNRDKIVEASGITCSNIGGRNG
jgi:hypothetical protein